MAYVFFHSEQRLAIFIWILVFPFPNNCENVHFKADSIIIREYLSTIAYFSSTLLYGMEC